MWRIVIIFLLQTLCTDAVAVDAGSPNFRHLLKRQLTERNKRLIHGFGVQGLQRRQAVATAAGNTVLDSDLSVEGETRWLAPELKLLIFIVDMCSKGGGPATSPKAVWNFLRDAPTNLADYYATCSYGRTKINLNLTTVVGPIMMPCMAGNWTVSSCYGYNPYGWFDWLEQYAINKLKINVSQYNHRVMILPREHQSFQESCTWSGISTTGSVQKDPRNPIFLPYSYSYTWIAGDTWDNLWLWFHELGHAHWLQHASSPDGGEYGDSSSAMGAVGSFGLRCYNAPQNWQLGWSSPFVMLTRENLRPGIATTWWIPAAHLDPDHYMRISLPPSFSTNDQSGVPLMCLKQLWVSYRISSSKYDNFSMEADLGALYVHLWSDYQFWSPDHPMLQATLALPNAPTLSEVKGSTYELPMCRLVINALDMWNGYALVSVCIKTADVDVEVDCTNGLDDDCDGLLDAADPDCQGKNAVLQQMSSSAPISGDNGGTLPDLQGITTPGLIFDGLLNVLTKKPPAKPSAPPPPQVPRLPKLHPRRPLPPKPEPPPLPPPPIPPPPKGRRGRSS